MGPLVVRPRVPLVVCFSSAVGTYSGIVACFSSAVGMTRMCLQLKIQRSPGALLSFFQLRVAFNSCALIFYDKNFPGFKLTACPWTQSGLGIAAGNYLGATHQL